VQNIKNLSYLQKLLSGQTYPVSQPFPELTKHIRLSSWIPEASFRHVWPPT
jgi:hypothetical protein